MEHEKIIKRGKDKTLHLRIQGFKGLRSRLQLKCIKTEDERMAASHKELLSQIDKKFPGTRAMKF